MLSFTCDYTQGAHPKILERLLETNMEKLPGYGNDHYCESAKEKIKKACGCPDAEVWFLTGGTQTNATVIDSVLQKYEGVISAQTGHINAHESGAVEFTGHKVLTLPGHEGRIRAEELETLLKTFWADGSHEHMVFPGMVYLSHPTEYGTLYTKAELEAISAICRNYEIPLYLDGARLGYGLMSYDTDVTLPMIAHLCDIFYIGGTKVGALCGEAVVFTKKNAPRHFAWGTPGERTPDRHPVRHTVYQRSVFSDQQTCHRNGGTSEEGVCGERIFLFLKFSDESAVYYFRERETGRSSEKGRL